QLAMLREGFRVVGALDHVNHPVIDVGTGKWRWSLAARGRRSASAVGAGQEVAVAVVIEAPHVSAAFGKQFEAAAPGMISPDGLLELESTDLRRNRAALTAIQPAVRSPDERVGKRLCILDPKAAQQHLGRRIRNI